MVRVGQTSISIAAGLLTLALVLSGERVVALEQPTLRASELAFEDVGVVFNWKPASSQAMPTIADLNSVMTLASSTAKESVDSAPPNRTLRLPWWSTGGTVALMALLGTGLWWRNRQAATSLTVPQPTANPATDHGKAEPFDSLATSSSNQPGNPTSETLPTHAALTAPLDATSRLTPVNIVDTLMEELASSDPTVRHRAIWELGQRGNSSAIQPLVNGLLEADSQEKSLILAALAEISSRSLQPMHRALALGLQDPSPEVRKNAIRDLSRVYDTAVQLSHMLVHATQDPNPEVQETARWALGQLNRIRATHYPEALPTESAYVGDRLPPSP